jgi:hypothetical protein
MPAPKDNSDRDHHEHRHDEKSCGNFPVTEAHVSALRLTGTCHWSPASDISRFELVHQQAQHLIKAKYHHPDAECREN